MPDAPHLLLVEDEPAMLHILQATLEYGGLTSDVAATALEAMNRLQNGRYDAVLTDLGLPDLDGVHLIKAVRTTSNIPILVVSGRGAEQDKIDALDIGADDFIAKPFLPGELLARIRAVLRRHALISAAAANDVRDDRQPQAVGTANSVRLAPLETKLFRLLESRRGEVVTNEEIFEEVWGAKQRGPANLRLLVLNLRRKLTAHGEPVEISNVWGDGYRLSRLRREREA
jgi:two-component system KDP operon response regulator KdpE